MSPTVFTGGSLWARHCAQYIEYRSEQDEALSSWRPVPVTHKHTCSLERDSEGEHHHGGRQRTMAGPRTLRMARKEPLLGGDVGTETWEQTSGKNFLSKVNSCPDSGTSVSCWRNVQSRRLE